LRAASVTLYKAHRFMAGAFTHHMLQRRLEAKYELHCQFALYCSKLGSVIMVPVVLASKAKHIYASMNHRHQSCDTQRSQNAARDRSHSAHPSIPYIGGGPRVRPPEQMSVAQLCKYMAYSMALIAAWRTASAPSAEHVNT
jgi:hypothetical protein